MIQPGKREQLLSPEVPVPRHQVRFGAPQECNSPGDSTGSFHTWILGQYSHLRDWDFSSPRARCIFQTYSKRRKDVTVAR